MPQHLETWMTQRPELADHIQANPTLATILDNITYKKEVTDEQWSEITNRLNT